MQAEPLLPAVGERVRPRRRRPSPCGRCGSPKRDSIARSASRWPPYAAGSITRITPSRLHSTLPFHRSPCRRDGGSSGSRSAKRPMTASIASASVSEAAPRSRASLRYGKHPAGRVELRPRRRCLVRQRQPADEAVVVEPVRRRAGQVRRGQCLAEGHRGVDGALPGLDPAQDQALVVAPEHLGYGDPTGLREPAQAACLGVEEPLRRLVVGLDQGGGAVAQPDPGGRRDVAAGHRRRGHHRGPQQLLRPLGDVRQPGHGVASSRCRAATMAVLVRSTMRNTSWKPRGPP